ncbi:MAG: hypothetical protein ACK2TU_04730, partial [Anaerolineales bacterium]
RTGNFWKWGLNIWAWTMTSRFRLDFISHFTRFIYRFFLPFLSKGKRKRIPVLPAKTFAEIWKIYEKQK